MSHRILLNNKEIEFTIKKNRLARQVRLMIHKNGRVAVSGPRFVTLKFIRNFLIKKQEWILDTLDKCVPDNPDKITISKKDFTANKRAALKIVHEKLSRFSSIYNLHPKKIYIRNQSTRWGSCSSKGNLSFNFRLVYLPDHLLDYLIIHELCHLQEMNHSHRFWSLVAKTVPDFKKRKTALRAEGRRLL